MPWHVPCKCATIVVKPFQVLSLKLKKGFGKVFSMHFKTLVCTKTDKNI